MENSRSYDHITAVQILRIIGRRRDALHAEWDAMEKGTQQSSEKLAAAEQLTDLKWEIIEALDVDPQE
jgi:hypothetical protein